MSAIEWAWAAGIVEGEGCIVSRRRGTHAALVVKMGDRDVLERLAALIPGGTLRCDPSRNAKHRDMWVWSLARRQSLIMVLERLYPMMGSRRRARIDAVLPGLREGRSLVADGWTCGGRPAASAFGLGCRCDGCKQAKREARRVETRRLAA